MTKAQTTSTDTGSTTKAKPKTMHHHTVTDWRTGDQAAYLGDHSMGVASVAFSGLQTVLALLMQNEVDREHEHGSELSGYSVEGLLCAAEACAELAQQMMMGKGMDGHVYECGTPQHEYIKAHVRHVAGGRMA